MKNLTFYLCYFAKANPCYRTEIVTLKEKIKSLEDENVTLKVRISLKNEKTILDMKNNTINLMILLMNYYT